jgi:hypothetical protein
MAWLEWSHLRYYLHDTIETNDAILAIPVPLNLTPGVPWAHIAAEEEANQSSYPSITLRLSVSLPLLMRYI